MPLTLRTPLTERLGTRIWEQIPGDRSIHLVVVATGGVGMGIAAVAMAPASRLRSVTVVKRAFDFDSPELTPDPEDAVVVLDNSVHSGRSLAKVIGHLKTRGIAVDCVITIFEGAHECEQLARKRLETIMGLPVRSCARWRDRHDWA
jgi:orotate phosphoribosyltransferase